MIGITKYLEPNSPTNAVTSGRVTMMRRARPCAVGTATVVAMVSMMGGEHAAVAPTVSKSRLARAENSQRGGRLEGGVTMAADPVFAILEAIDAATVCFNLAPRGSRAEFAAERMLDYSYEQLGLTVPTTADGLLVLIELARGEEDLDAEHVLELVTAGLLRMSAA